MTTWESNASFAAALDACCQRVKNGEPLEDCLADYPAAYHSELTRLVPVAGRLAKVGQDPTPAFQARLERQLLTAVAEEQRRQRVGWLSRLLSSFLLGPVARIATIVAVVFVIIIAGGYGVVNASDNTLPGNPLYYVKVVRESAAMALARDGSAKVGVNANQIAERGHELKLAIQLRASPRTVQSVALRLAQATNQMVNLALELRTNGNPQPANRALATIRTMQQRLDVLIGQASPADRPTLERLRAFLSQEEQRLETSSRQPGAGRSLTPLRPAQGKLSGHSK